MNATRRLVAPVAGLIVVCGCGGRVRGNPDNLSSGGNGLSSSATGSSGPDASSSSSGASANSGSGSGSSGGVAARCGTAVRGAPVQLAMLASAWSLASDGQYVYAAPYGVGAVTRISIADCSVLSLNPFGGGNIAIDATRVYTVSPPGGSQAQGLVISCPKSGCNGGYATLASGMPSLFDVAVDGTDVYFTNQSTPSVLKAPLAGGSTTTLVENGSAEDIAVVAGQVIYDGTPGSTGTASLWSVPTSGGTPRLLYAPASGSVDAVAVDAHNVYFATTSGLVGQLPLAGGVVTTLAPGSGGNTTIAIDATNVYWGAQGTSDIFTTPIGGGTVTKLDPVPGNVVRLAVDARYVYATVGLQSGVAVFELAK